MVVLKGQGGRGSARSFNQGGSGSTGGEGSKRGYASGGKYDPWNTWVGEQTDGRGREPGGGKEGKRGGGTTGKREKRGGKKR